LWQCDCRIHGWFRVYTPFILPNKHYAPLRIDAALACAAEDGSMIEFCSETGIHDPCTPFRWVGQWADRLINTGQCIRRYLARLVGQLRHVVLPTVDPPSEWTLPSAWAFLGDVRQGWPLESPVPPRSFLALKA
jgi:hypothetical protein